MLILEPNEEKELVLGDYVTVHVADVVKNLNPVRTAVLSDLQVRNEAFFQRIQKERTELTGMRLRGAA